MIDESTWRTVEGLGGVVFATTLIVSTIVVDPRPPEPHAEAEVVDAHYAGSRTRTLLSVFLHGVALVAYLFFIAGLYSKMRNAEGGSGTVAILIVLGGLGVNTVIAFSHVLQGVLAYSVAGRGNPVLARALHDIVSLAHAFFAFPVAVLYTAAAISIIGTHALPHWLGWVAAVLAAFQVVHAFTLLDRGRVFFVPGGILSFASLLTFLAWVAAVGIALM